MKKSILGTTILKNCLIVVFFLFSLHSYSQTFSFMFGGVSRSYIVHTPTGYNASTKYPLVLNLHGLTSNASQEQSYTGMNAVADTGKFIVVYPDGVNNTWNAGAGNSTTDDVGFISALIDTMGKKFGVNANKVFSCGFSMGGYMSHRLGCQLSNKIAAIATVSGLNAVTSSCTSTCPLPVMHFHGTSDGTVNYSGAAATVNFWVTKDGCPSTSVDTNVPDINTSDGCTVVKSVYAPGNNSSEVIFFKITGGGHTWPGGPALTSNGNTCQDIKASGEIWNFFRRHSLLCGATAVDEPSTFDDQLSAFPNPSNGVFNLNMDKVENAQIKIYNMYGEYIYEQNLKSTNQKIDLSSQPSGVYFLQVKTDTGSATKKIVIAQ